jgi:23S rRNA (uracil1939-C5)-methyltransferase
MRVVSRAVELLQLVPTDTVLDLFCGIKLLVAVPRAYRAHRWRRGRQRSSGVPTQRQVNRIQNAEFHTADLAVRADLPWAAQRYDRVLIDPPGGREEILSLIARCDASCVVYISCHAGSLARDAGILVREHGFLLASAGVMDMFPHTAHVEAIAVFVRQITK